MARQEVRKYPVGRSIGQIGQGCESCSPEKAIGCFLRNQRVDRVRSLESPGRRLTEWSVSGALVDLQHMIPPHLPVQGICCEGMAAAVGDWTAVFFLTFLTFLETT